jgi:GMP synthase-like glutamine amidotransferase
MRAHYFQHVPFEGLGSIAPWLRRQGYEISKTEFFSSATLPALADMDLLIVMGGPMSVNDEHRLPWLVPEKRFLYDAIACGVPVLGICLGAQLIASALGARVYRNREKEIGWFPVRGVPSAEKATFRFPCSPFIGTGRPLICPMAPDEPRKAMGARTRLFKSDPPSSDFNFIWKPPLHRRGRSFPTAATS